MGVSSGDHFPPEDGAPSLLKGGGPSQSSGVLPGAFGGPNPPTHPHLHPSGTRALPNSPPTPSWCSTTARPSTRTILPWVGLGTPCAASSRAAGRNFIRENTLPTRELFVIFIFRGWGIVTCVPPPPHQKKHELPPPLELLSLPADPTLGGFVLPIPSPKINKHLRQRERAPLHP